MSDFQTSNKVGVVHDEQLKHDTQGLVRAGRSTHAQEWKDPEPSGEDQPDVDAQPAGTMTGATPEGMSPAEVEDRSALASRLGRAYPADKTKLIETAKTNNATDRLLNMLQQLPEGESYDNVQDVWTALGHDAESARF